MSMPRGMELLLMESSMLKLIAKRKRKRTHTLCTDRHKHGEFNQLYPLLREAPEKFFEYTGMSIPTFDYIVQCLEGKVHHISTNFQQPITLEERLIITIRFLATGIPFRQLAFSFRVGKTTAGNIVHEMCGAIWTVLQPVHIPVPDTEYFVNAATDFEQKWKFPNCIGCVAGKHVRLFNAANSGSMHYNYKHFDSIVLLAVIDANYRFSMVDIVAYGKDSDGGVFNNSSLYTALESGQITLPQASTLSHTNVKLPYVLLGEAAFPLKKYLMRPFPTRQLSIEYTNFNTRLSRARRVVKCSFGILTAKWGILHRAIETKMDNADQIVKCTTLLHNIIIDREGIDPGLLASVDNSPFTSTFHTHVRNKINSSTREARETRQAFCQYFSSPAGRIDE